MRSTGQGPGTAADTSCGARVSHDAFGHGLSQRASNDRYAELDMRGAQTTSSPQRYSLLCHETRTRVVVGTAGRLDGEMVSAIRSDSAMDAFCGFLMHNRLRTLHVHADALPEPAAYGDYFEFAGWSHRPPSA